MDQFETPSREEARKDLPLRYDTRLLGRILGETVRDQEGDAVFDLVEHIRRTGVLFHREADEAARQELEATMSGLPMDRALRIICAFGHFSHLANIAEDQHHIRRTRALAIAKAPPQQGTMAYALGRAAIVKPWKLNRKIERQLFRNDRRDGFGSLASRKFFPPLLIENADPAAPQSSPV